jgi:hypothetical protein
MLTHIQPQVIALFTVRVDLVILLMATLGKRLPAEHWLHLVAASVPVLRARDSSVGTFLSRYRAPLVLFDLTSPYRANWRALQQARAEGALRDDRLMLLTSNKQALEEAIGPNTASELHATASDMEGLLVRLRQLLAASPAESSPHRFRHPQQPVV